MNFRYRLSKGLSGDVFQPYQLNIRYVRWYSLSETWELQVAYQSVQPKPSGKYHAWTINSKPFQTMGEHPSGGTVSALNWIIQKTFFFFSFLKGKEERLSDNNTSVSHSFSSSWSESGSTGRVIRSNEITHKT